jgi:hypothetical protein
VVLPGHVFAVAVHAVSPAPDVVPCGHAVHALEPASAAKVPAAHGVHAVLSPRPKVPAAHAVHPALVALGTQYVPAQQHTVEPVGVHCWKVTPEVQPEVEQVVREPVKRDHSSIENIPSPAALVAKTMRRK